MLKSRSDPILTIAIPTYNRENYLDLCLQKIREEAARLREDSYGLVKILVSDNHSPDNTQNIVAKHKELAPGMIESIRNVKNIGPDNNIVQCYAHPTTPYVWVFGDDDVILEGGLQQVLDALITKDIDLLFVNSYAFDNDYLEKKYSHYHVPLAVMDAFAFAKRTNVLLTFLSTTIMRSGSGAQFRAELKDTSMIQLSWIYPLLNGGEKFGVIENYIVAAKAANSGGYGLVEVFGKNLDTIGKRILVERAEIAKIIQNSVIVNFFPFYIIDMKKGRGNFSKENMGPALRALFKKNWRYYLFIVPMLQLPMTLAKAYFLFLRLLRRAFKSIII